MVGLMVMARVLIVLIRQSRADLREEVENNPSIILGYN